MPSPQVVWNESLIRRYDLSGPRYTSYPTAVQFDERFGEADCRQAAEEGRLSGKPLSLYFHIPFCAHLCYYCACNKIITKRREKAQPYLDRLYRDMQIQVEMHGNDRQVEQLHWGGGTPTFISHDQMRELMAETRRLFRLRDDDRGDYSIEIDPREASSDTLKVLREIGFNRISLGVQDLDPKVQKAVNRIQPLELTQNVLQAARDEGFRSINLDLIYGLPHQTIESFAATVEKVLELSPDRLSVFNYAHMPGRFYPQTRIREEDLPPPEHKLIILQQTIDRLLSAGYEYIGMDHFAKPDDELAVAQRTGQLHRNFQGYTTHGNCDLVAMGVSAISQVGRAYYQNHHEMAPYEEAIDAGRLPIKRGAWLTEEDDIRRAVIMQLICHFQLNFAEWSKRLNIDFQSHFAAELAALRPMADDGLLTLNNEEIAILPAGRLLIRAICKEFDQYLPKQAPAQGFSRII